MGDSEKVSSDTVNQAKVTFENMMIIDTQAAVSRDTE
jgi:hypothetical protein